jgi:hypothetical protein
MRAGRGREKVVEMFREMAHVEREDFGGEEEGEGEESEEEMHTNQPQGHHAPTSPPSLLSPLSTSQLATSFSHLTFHDIMGLEAAANLDNPNTSEECFAETVRLVQRKMRWWLYRRHGAAKKLQAAARGMIVRKNMKRMRDSALRIQSMVRQRSVRKKFMRLKEATKKIQRLIRSRDRNTPLHSSLNIVPIPRHHKNSSSNHEELHGSSGGEEQEYGERRFGGEGSHFEENGMTFVAQHDFFHNNSSPLPPHSHHIDDSSSLLHPSSLYTPLSPSQHPTSLFDDALLAQQSQMGEEMVSPFTGHTLVDVGREEGFLVISEEEEGGERDLMQME